MNTEKHFEQATKDLAEIIPEEDLRGLSAEELHLSLVRKPSPVMPEHAQMASQFERMRLSEFLTVHAAALKLLSKE